MRKTVHGVSTSFQIIGKESSTKKDVILLHGWGCTWEIWSPIITELSSHARVIIPDLPAFGQSSEPETAWSSYDYANWLVDFIEQTATSKKIVLVGHSFGGKIACIVAAQRPDLLSQLVVVDASGLPDKLPLHRQLQEKVVSVVPLQIKESLKSSMKQVLSHFIQLSPDYLNASKYQKTVLRKILKENISDSLTQISIPTTIIWGVNDDATPISQGKNFHKLIKNSQWKPIEQSGHFPFVDQTGIFLDLLKKLL